MELNSSRTVINDYSAELVRPRDHQESLRVLDRITKLLPPAPVPRTIPLGPIALLGALVDNPLEAWTEAHFIEPVVMGGVPFVRVAVVSDPGAIKRVLLDNADNYKKDWVQRRILSAGLSDGLLTAETKKWRTQRRILAPLFSPKAVARFSDAMIASADGLVARLKPQRGRVVDVAVEMTRVSLDVLERTIFSEGLGDDPEEIRKAMKSYFDAIGQIDAFDLLGLPASMPRFGRRKARPALRLFDRAIDEVISRRRRRIAENPEHAPQDLLTLLLRAQDPETGDKLSEEDVRSNILTFIAAGHETTANCLTWSVFLLSQSPEWYDRVRAEAERELNGDHEGLADRLIDTRAVLDEANRLYPPITAISRAAIGADELAGRAIRPGTMIVIAPYVLHRHTTLWDEPDRFDPSRFVGGAREKIARFAYLPFGGGPRTCIGASFAMQEASIVLATLVRYFRFDLAPGHDVWPVQRVSLRPRGGLPIIVS
jgi:cytochrome P450